MIPFTDDQGYKNKEAGAASVDLHRWVSWLPQRAIDRVWQDQTKSRWVLKTGKNKLLLLFEATV